MHTARSWKHKIQQVKSNDNSLRQLTNSSTDLSTDSSLSLSIFVSRILSLCLASSGLRSSNSSASFLLPMIASWSKPASCSPLPPWCLSRGLKAPSASLSPPCPSF